jgi:hypothetical protein
MNWTDRIERRQTAEERKEEKNKILLAFQEDRSKRKELVHTVGTVASPSSNSNCNNNNNNNNNSNSSNNNNNSQRK